MIRLKSWGIALGAGGILGFAHLGVLEVLEKRGLKPGFIAGTSAGALVGGLWALGVASSVIKSEMQTMLLDKRVSDLSQGILTLRQHSTDGLVSTMAVSGLLDGFLIETLIDRLTKSKKVSDVSIGLSIVSCDLITGNVVVFTNFPCRLRNESRKYSTDAALSAAIRASISLPGIFVPKKFGNMELVDGGIKEMVPAYEIRRMGAKAVLAVDLGSHIDRCQKVKSIYSVLTRSFNLASRGSTLAHLDKYASMTLQPEVWDIGFPTPSKIKALINAGRVCAERHIDQWINLITQEENH